MGDTTPQDPEVMGEPLNPVTEHAIRVAREAVREMSLRGAGGYVIATEAVCALADAGLLAAPQAGDEGGPERSDPDDAAVERVAEALWRDEIHIEDEPRDENDLRDAWSVIRKMEGLGGWEQPARAAISALHTVSRPASSTEDLT